MSNLKVLLILFVILFALLAGAVRELFLPGYLVGIGLVMYLLPAMVVCALIIGIVCGLRK